MSSDPYREINLLAYDDASSLVDDLRDPRYVGKSVEWIANNQAEGHDLTGQAKQVYVSNFIQVWNEEKRKNKHR